MPIPGDELWEQRFSELENYIRIYRHARIPRSSVIHSELREWLRYQQRMAANGTLPMERWWRFQQIGVTLLGNDERWYMRFAQLREFRERFGHCRVPAKWKEDKPFGHWAHVQREFKKKGRLSAARIAMLESIGFEWKTRWVSSGSGEAHWEEMLGHLRRFAAEHGHADVHKGAACPAKLYGWVLDQREAQNTGRLRPDRRERLDALGFVWRSTFGQTTRWDLRFEQLRQFRERFGHCHVAAKWKENIPLGHWVSVQRDFKKKGMLSMERIQRLAAIGFDWEVRGPMLPQEEQWRKRYAQLAQFVQEHGHADVPKHSSLLPGLRRWILEQHRAERHGELRADRREMLAAIGFPWKYRRADFSALWEQRFAQLLQYRERFGHCRVPAKWKEDVPFGHWVHVQRAFKKEGKLVAERIARLEAIGFEWRGPHSRAWLHDDRWKQMFAQLAAWQKEHGHTEAPPSCRVPGLGQWVLAQREHWRRGTLQPERRARLESIGFAWQGTGRDDEEQWNRRFQQLLAWRERHGHCRVPPKWKEDVPFGYWVSVQREFKKKGLLRAERVQRLESIGFEWQVPRAESAWCEEHWERKFVQLAAYRTQHGHMRVPKSHRGDGLRQWVQKQRRDERKKVLPANRRARLEAIGFEWEPRQEQLDARWQKRFGQLLTFRQQHGHCRVPANWRENISLGHWVHDQRKEEKRGTLGAERLRRLESIGFEWEG